MDWDTWACVSSLCRGRFWHAELVGTGVELWNAAESHADPGALIVETPACPACGENLCAVLDLKGVLSHDHT